MRETESAGGSITASSLPSENAPKSLVGALPPPPAMPTFDGQVDSLGSSLHSQIGPEVLQFNESKVLEEGPVKTGSIDRFAAKRVMDAARESARSLHLRGTVDGYSDDDNEDDDDDDDDENDDIDGSSHVH